MNNLEANDWVETSIRDLEGVGAIELGRGKIISQKDIDANPGKYPVYSSSARGRGEFGRYGKYMFDEELVTWSVDGGGKFFYRPQGRYSITNVSGFLRVKDKEMLDTYYAWAHLYSQWQTMTFNYTEKLHPSVLRDRFSFAYPPLPHQRTIGEILKSVQHAIEAQERIIQITTELKQALMQKLFSEGLRGEPQKETEIGLVPESWEVEKIKNHCIDSAFGPRFGSDLYAEDGNILTLRTTDMEDDGRINYNTAPLACIEYTKFRNHYLQVGDVIVSRSGTCGIASVFEGHSLPVLPGAFLIRLRMKETVQPMYLRHYINSPVGRPYVLQLAQGAIQKNISGTRLGELLIPLPTRAEQEEISSAVRSFDQRLVLHRHKLRAKRDLFSTLIHELMTTKSHLNLYTINGHS
jgi:restriction endonuclease S subunit